MNLLSFFKRRNAENEPKITLKRGQKIQLALGGGAVLGAAHIGALKAMEELELEITRVAGTSIGALVGALYASGNDFSHIEDVALDLSWTDITGFTFSKFGFFSNDKIRGFLEEAIGKEATFADCQLPLFIVATDITNGDKIILQEGDLSNAVMASTCLPGIYKPVEINGKLLVDGGIVENVPISPLQDRGDEPIIAIDLNARHTYETPKNIVDVLLNSFHFMLATAAKEQTQEADILIKPNLSNFNRVDSNQIEDLIKVGYEDTLKALEGYF
jgi:NTE family protein